MFGYKVSLILVKAKSSFTTSAWSNAILAKGLNATMMMNIDEYNFSREYLHVCKCKTLCHLLTVNKLIAYRICLCYLVMLVISLFMENDFLTFFDIG